MRRATVILGVCLIAVALTAAITQASGARRLELRDKCDQATFDAAVGPGTCQPIFDDGVPFPEFFAQISPAGGPEEWRFEFGRGKLDKGETLNLVNRGGELHTFSAVDQFGPGCVPPINAAMGFGPIVAPVCNDVTNVGTPGNPVFVPTIFLTDGVPSGGTRPVSGLSKGTHKFQCMIHPWMHTEITVR